MQLNPQIMENKVSDFISSFKRDELEKKNEMLISLGLYDDSKTERKYIPERRPNSKWDKEKKGWYTEKFYACNVTDEEYKIILKAVELNAEKVKNRPIKNYEGNSYKSNSFYLSKLCKDLHTIYVIVVLLFVLYIISMIYAASIFVQM